MVFSTAQTPKPIDVASEASVTRPLWLVSILVLATFLVYLNSFPGAFHFDDFPLLIDNPRISQPQFDYSAFLDQYGGRPLTLWTLHWNYRLFGRNPFSYHLFSVFLHLFVVVEMFLLILSLSGRRLLAFATTLLFALHPLQTQTVNYIWSRSVLLTAVFGLASLLLAKKHPWRTLICFQLAIWSRTEAVVLLIPLIVLNRSRWKGPLTLMLVNVVAFLYSLLAYTPQEIGWTHPKVVHYWSFLPIAFWKYALLIIWPVGLNLDPDVSLPGPTSTLLAAVGLLALLVLALRFVKRYPVPSFGILWFGLMLAPSLLIPNSDVFNESRAYLASAGLILVVCWIVSTGMERTRFLVTVGVVCLGLVLLVPITLSRNRIWNDDLALWLDTVSKSPSKDRPHYNLGVAFVHKGRTREAETEFKKAVDLNPQYDFGYAGLGYCAEVRSNFAAALSYYRKALQFNPDNDYAKQRVERIENKITGKKKL